MSGVRVQGDAGKALRDLGAKLASANEVRVGFLEGSQGGRGATMPAPELAYILEFGAPKAGIPMRPFFRSMIGKQSPTWGQLLAAAMKKSGNDSKIAMAIVGQRVKEQLQRSMDEFTPYWKNEKDKAAMMKRKGFLRVLEDSKNLRNAADFQVT